MRLPVFYTAPYSYTSSPIETLFAHLKLGELNPGREPVGKKYVRFPYPFLSHPIYDFL